VEGAKWKVRSGRCEVEGAKWKVRSGRCEVEIGLRGWEGLRLVYGCDLEWEMKACNVPSLCTCYGGMGMLDELEFRRATAAYK
jgi:hypothetical protein